MLAVGVLWLRITRLLWWRRYEDIIFFRWLAERDLLWHEEVKRRQAKIAQVSNARLPPCSALSDSRCLHCGVCTSSPQTSPVICRRSRASAHNLKQVSQSTGRAQPQGKADVSNEGWAAWGASWLGWGGTAQPHVEAKTNPEDLTQDDLTLTLTQEDMRACREMGYCSLVSVALCRCCL